LRVAACLGAWLALLGLRRGLGVFARELAGRYCPFCLKIRLLWSFTGFQSAKFTKKCPYLGHFDEFERKSLHVRSKPKKTLETCRDTPITNRARGSKKI
jgi:hypothetical protein